MGCRVPARTLGSGYHFPGRLTATQRSAFNEFPVIVFHRRPAALAAARCPVQRARPGAPARSPWLRPDLPHSASRARRGSARRRRGQRRDPGARGARRWLGVANEDRQADAVATFPLRAPTKAPAMATARRRICSARSPVLFVFTRATTWSSALAMSAGDRRGRRPGLRARAVVGVLVDPGGRPGPRREGPPDAARVLERGALDGVDDGSGEGRGKGGELRSQGRWRRILPQQACRPTPYGFPASVGSPHRIHWVEATS